MCQNSEILLEDVLEEAYKTKSINIEVIDKFDLSEECFENIMNYFKDNKIEIIEFEDPKSEDSIIKGIEDSVNLYLKDIGRIKLLTPEEEKKLFLEYKNGDKRVKKQLIEANLRLVVTIAKKYVSAVHDTTLDFLDLIQEGNEGLMIAVDRFDVEKGYKFSTYASWWIRQAITKSIIEKKHTIRLSVNLSELLRKMNVLEHNYLKKYGRVPTTKEYAEELNVSEDRIKTAQVASIGVVSFSTPVGEDGETTVEDFVEATTNLQEEVENKMYMDGIFEIANEVLTTREFEVLLFRNGFRDNRVYTLEEIGKMFNLTRERVRQIERDGLKKIRQRIEFNDRLFERRIEKVFKQNKGGVK